MLSLKTTSLLQATLKTRKSCSVPVFIRHVKPLGSLLHMFQVDKVELLHLGRRPHHKKRKNKNVESDQTAPGSASSYFVRDSDTGKDYDYICW